MSYAQFIERKAQDDGYYGFDPEFLPDWLFGFQAALVQWAVRKGRGAIFADCGLGKTPMQLVWAENVRRHTGKPVLIATPLAVAAQTQQEAEKFWIEAAVSRDGSVTAPVTITNYERLHLFDPALFARVVCDESSAIKAFDSERRGLVTAFMRKLPYRLLCTATAAPNDYIELGTSSEALGALGYMDMLGRFFTNKQRSSKAVRAWGDTEWRFKGHAEEPFWRWVASWARALRFPSDLGFADDGFILPALDYRQHVVSVETPAEDRLFDVPAVGMDEERSELRRSITERCEMAADLVEGHDVSISWCNLNAEGDLLERLIPNSVQVRGSDADEYKALAARWFTGDLCICDRSEFRAKLAAWDKGPRGTGRITTQSTESSASLSRSLTSRPTASSDALTHASGRPTTASTFASTAQPPRTSETRDGVSDMPVTSNTANKRGEKHASGSEPTPKSDSRNGSSGTESRPSNTTPCSTRRVEAALSAGRPSATNAAAAYTSTTATTRDTSGASSAATATSGSANSPTTPTGLSAPRCTCGHASGVRRLITKPVMFGLGLNFQHCSHMTYFPTHSYQHFYQAVRRCWRFGQESPVLVDLITTEGGHRALANLQRKASQADRMFAELVAHMNDALQIERTTDYEGEVSVPAWL